MFYDLQFHSLTLPPWVSKRSFAVSLKPGNFSLGRILSRLSKDQDTLDSTLTMTLMQFLNTFSSVLGTVALVFYTFPLLGIIFAPMTVFYYFISIYYRRSSVETKRLDSLMRSALYSSYSGNLNSSLIFRHQLTEIFYCRNSHWAVHYSCISRTGRCFPLTLCPSN